MHEFKYTKCLLIHLLLNQLKDNIMNIKLHTPNRAYAILQFYVIKLFLSKLHVDLNLSVEKDMSSW